MISQLHLLNFKCFEDQTFQFKPLTVLTGLNGTGKSSVLQSLLVLCQSYPEIIDPESPLILNGELVNIGLATDVMLEGAKSNTVGIEINTKAESGVEIEEKWLFIHNPLTNRLDKVEETPSFFIPFLYGRAFHYLQAERIGPRLFFNTTVIRDRNERLLDVKGEYTAHFLAMFGDKITIESGLAHKNEPSLTLKRQVEAWLGEISPGIRITLNAITDLELVELRYSSQFGNILNESTSNDATLPSRDYRSTNVGFGITYALPVIVAVLSSKRGALLLIENPEAHLHPRGQAQMGHLLARAASCGIQVVIETHSDHLLNGIRLAVHDGKIDPDQVQLHFLQRQERTARIEVISPRIDRDGRIDQWPDGFFDEWERNLMALLEPRSE
jgi:predicted ATPase